MSKQFKNAGPDSFDTVLTLEQKWLKSARQTGTNLIPPGSTYDFNQNFTIAVNQGHSYRAVLSAPNDQTVSDGITVFGNGAGTYTFTPASGTLTFHGTNVFISVTATLVFLS